MNDLVLNSARISSIANNTPPSGALKAAVIALAAPQPTKVLVSSTVFPVLWPISEPTVEEITTIGPTLPSDIPVPIQVAAAKHLAIAFFALRRACLKVTASITSGTPAPFASLDQYSIISPASKPPSAGMNIIFHSSPEPTNELCMKLSP